MRLLPIVVGVALLTSLACHPAGPVIDTGPKPPVVRATIAGIVSTDKNAAVAGRKVTAIDTAGKRYEATTGSNGGYTIQVPEGTYRLEVELRPGEKVAKQPARTKVDKSDLDPHRDFVITAGG